MWENPVTTESEFRLIMSIHRHMFHILSSFHSIVNLSFGNSSLKSREIRDVQSRTANIFATMSFFCQRPRQDSPDGEAAILVWRCKSAMFIPLWRDSVASPVKQTKITRILSNLLPSALLCQKLLRTPSGDYCENYKQYLQYFLLTVTLHWFTT